MSEHSNFVKFKIEDVQEFLLKSKPVRLGKLGIRQLE